jgi:hypothetical protein
MFYGLKIGAKTHFKSRSLPKLVFIKLQGYSVVIPLFYKPSMSGLWKHLWENLLKEMIMSPFVYENIYQSLTPFFETLFNFPMAWSPLNTCSIIASSDARLASNDWPCVVSWFCVTLFDFDELFVCSYDLQIGMWPNLSKTNQILYCPMEISL